MNHIIIKNGKESNFEEYIWKYTTTEDSAYVITYNVILVDVA